MESKGLNSIPFPYELEDDTRSRKAPAYHRGPPSLQSFFKNLGQDDLILILLIILLLAEGSECDYLLIGVLIFIFLAGIDGLPL